jgi:hypothetical protein
MGRKKRKKRKGVKPQRPRQLETPPLPKISPKTSLWRRILRWKWASIVVLATVVTLFQGYPWLSVQRGGMLNPRNPYSEMFEVSNGGYIPLTDVRVLCIFNAQSSSIHISDSRFESDVAAYLEHGRTATVPCFYVFDISEIPGRAHFQMTITYAFYHLNLRMLRRSQVFQFESIPSEDGTQHWQFISYHVTPPSSWTFPLSAIRATLGELAALSSSTFTSMAGFDSI